MSRNYGDGMRWQIHKGGGAHPSWIVRPAYAIHGFGTRWQFPTFEAACAAFRDRPHLLPKSGGLPMSEKEFRP